MSIDETSLSDGELYTIVSNKDAKGKRGALAAIILGTKSEDVIAALKNIDQSVRETVTEITLDLSSSIRKIAHRAFPKAVQVTDRFHIQKLAMEALQEMRISFRWDAINEENQRRHPDAGCLDTASDCTVGEILWQASDPEAVVRLIQNHSGLHKARSLDTRPVHRKQHHRHCSQSPWPTFSGHRPGRKIPRDEQSPARGTE